jgi:hypothetical protein
MDDQMFGLKSIDGHYIVVGSYELCESFLPQCRQGTSIEPWKVKEIGRMYDESEVILFYEGNKQRT